MAQQTAVEWLKAEFNKWEESFTRIIKEWV